MLQQLIIPQKKRNFFEFILRILFLICYLHDHRVFFFLF